VQFLPAWQKASKSEEGADPVQLRAGRSGLTETDRLQKLLRERAWLVTDFAMRPER